MMSCWDICKQTLGRRVISAGGLDVISNNKISQISRYIHLKNKIEWDHRTHWVARYEHSSEQS